MNGLAYALHFGYGYPLPVALGISGSASSTKHDYTVSLSHGTSATGRFKEGRALTLRLSADEGYYLPSVLTIKRGLSSVTEYSWDEDTGLLTIDASETTGNLTITGTCSPEIYTGSICDMAVCDYAVCDTE